MRHRTIQLLTAWLCLVLIGVGNSAFASGLVLCRDADGGRHMEWGCTKDARGTCEQSCGQDAADDQGDPAGPCEDSPISTDQQTPRLSRSADQPDVLAALPCVLAPRCEWAIATPAVRFSTASPLSVGPRYIRTVVLRL